MKHDCPNLVSPVAWNLAFPWLCSVYYRKEQGPWEVGWTGEGQLNTGEGNCITAHKVLLENRIQIVGLTHQNSSHLMVAQMDFNPQLYSPTRKGQSAR